MKQILALLFLLVSASILQAQSIRYVEAGRAGFGSISKYDGATNTLTSVSDFNSEKGTYPVGGLCESTDGKFYGITQLGGTSGVGVVFPLDRSSSTYTKKKDFGTNTTGAFASATLVHASDNKPYGMTLPMCRKTLWICCCMFLCNSKLSERPFYSWQALSCPYIVTSKLNTTI
jgi:hypothetical protein